MADYSLVPVEHQPDFENVTLVAVNGDRVEAIAFMSAGGTAEQGELSV